MQVISLPNDAQRRGPRLRTVEMVNRDCLTLNKTKHFEIGGLECHFDGVPKDINGGGSPAYMNHGHAVFEAFARREPKLANAIRSAPLR